MARLPASEADASVTASKANKARFLAGPLPVALHALGATVFCTLGVFQLAVAKWLIARQRQWPPPPRPRTTARGQA